MPKRGKKYVAAAKKVVPNAFTVPSRRSTWSKTSLVLVSTRASSWLYAWHRPRKADQVLRVPFRCLPGPARACGWRSSPPAKRPRPPRRRADIVGSDDLVARVDGGFMDFDVA